MNKSLSDAMSARRILRNDAKISDYKSKYLKEKAQCLQFEYINQSLYDENMKVKRDTRILADEYRKIKNEYESLQKTCFEQFQTIESCKLGRTDVFANTPRGKEAEYRGTFEAHIAPYKDALIRAVNDRQALRVELENTENRVRALEGMLRTHGIK